MCNKVLFILDGCGHDSRNHPHMIPPAWESLCSKGLGDACPDLHVQEERHPNDKCPKCNGTGELPYSWYKHAWYSEKCGCEYGQKNSDLLRFLDEIDIVLVTPTAEHCGKPECRDKDIRKPEQAANFVNRSVMPREYENLTRVFTTAPSTALVPYLDRETMKPKTNLAPNRENMVYCPASSRFPGSARPRESKISTSVKAASKAAKSEMLETQMYHDDEELAAGFTSKYYDPNTLDFITQRRNADESTTTSRDRLFRRMAADECMQPGPGPPSSAGVYVGEENDALSDATPRMSLWTTLSAQHPDPSTASAGKSQATNGHLQSRPQAHASAQVPSKTKRI